MADFIKNVSNTVNVFGGGYSTKWGQAFGSPYTMTWGAAKWGEGAGLPIDVIKIITNSEALMSTVSKSSQKLIANTFLVTSLMGSEVLRDGSGLYEYVFTSNTNDGVTRNISSWAAGANSSVTYICQPVGTTTWA